MLELLGMITSQLVLKLLICQRFIVNYQNVKKAILLTRERALPIYAQAQQRFLVVRIRRLVKMKPMSFLHKMRNYFLFWRIYNRIFHLRQKVVATLLVGIFAQTRFLI